MDLFRFSVRSHLHDTTGSGRRTSSTYGFTTDFEHSGLRQIDLAGNVVRETNIARLNEQLAALGKSPIDAAHHDIRLLPNGNILLIDMIEKIINSQDYVGDGILVLDPNLQILWSWDIFDHLDPITNPPFWVKFAPQDNRPARLRWRRQRWTGLTATPYNWLRMGISSSRFAIWIGW